MILDRRGPSFWEVALIRGALWYRGVEARLLGEVPEGRSSRERPEDRLSWDHNTSIAGSSFVLLLPSPGEDTRPLSERLVRLGARAVVRAGFGQTLAGLGWTASPGECGLPPPPSGHEVVVLGEPYAAVARLACDPSYLEASLGRTITGLLLDPDHFRTPAPLAGHGAGSQSEAGTEAGPGGEPASEGGMEPEVRLLTSLGCEKHCGYCSMVAAYTRLYPSGVPRRERPWGALLSEMEAFRRAGVGGFRFLADQFLSLDRDGNGQLQAFVSAWRSRSAGDRAGRPRVVFTAGPAEIVRNRSLLAEMAAAFDIEPRVSLDSLDQATLDFLDLRSAPEAGLEAARLLAELGVPWRANYIFIRPGMTADRLRGELLRLLDLARLTTHFDHARRLLLTVDVFSHRLDILEGSPVAAKGVPRDYEGGLPREVLRVAVTIQREIERLVSLPSETQPSGVHPLAVAAEAGLTALDEGAGHRPYGPRTSPTPRSTARS